MSEKVLPDLWPPLPASVASGTGTAQTRAVPTDWFLCGVPDDIAAIEMAGSGASIGQVRQEPDLATQAYRLSITPEQVVLGYGDHDGLRYGLRTLKQLAADGQLACGTYHDAPATPVRGVMLDISRDRVPTWRQLTRVVDAVAALKGNHLQLYTEHTLAYRGHEAVWQDADPLSLQELADLAEYARQRGVQLGGNQNTLGHAERWLRHQPYRDWAEYDAATVAERLARRDVPCTSFAPVRGEVRAWAEDVLTQQMAALGGGTINLGCDEVLELGAGASAQAVQELGPAAIYGTFVGGLAEYCLARGWQPQFWADIALAHPAALRHIPAGTTALVWGYEADADFKGPGAALAEAGHAWWACPGTSSWRSLVGRREARRGSIGQAVTTGLAAGAGGVLITDWGDCGHRQPWAVSWLGLAEGLGAAWAGRAVTDADLPAIGRWGFGDVAASKVLSELSACEAPDLAQPPSHPLRDGPLMNAGLAFVDTLLGWHDQHDFAGPATAWQTRLERLRQLDLTGLTPTWQSELTYARDSLAVATARAVLRRGGTLPGGLAKWHSQLDELIAHARALWLTDSRPAGLPASLAHWQALADQ